MPRWSVLAVAATLLAGCTTAAPSASRPAPPTRTETVTATRSVDPAPVPAGPTSVRPGACPMVATSLAEGTVGMRLARSEVLVNRGRVTGCRFYALQGSVLHSSERLPGPKQPVIAVTSTRFRGALAARAALVRLARGGSNAQRASAAGAAGICYQQRFYPPDRGRDWACAFADGATVVLVRTVVTSPALDVVRLGRAVMSGS